MKKLWLLYLLSMVVFGADEAAQLNFEMTSADGEFVCTVDSAGNVSLLANDRSIIDAHVGIVATPVVYGPDLDSYNMLLWVPNTESTKILGLVTSTAVITHLGNLPTYKVENSRRTMVAALVEGRVMLYRSSDAVMLHANAVPGVDFSDFNYMKFQDGALFIDFKDDGKTQIYELPSIISEEAKHGDVEHKSEVANSDK